MPDYNKVVKTARPTVWLGRPPLKTYQGNSKGYRNMINYLTVDKQVNQL